MRTHWQVFNQQKEKLAKVVKLCVQATDWTAMKCARSSGWCSSYSEWDSFRGASPRVPVVLGQRCGRILESLTIPRRHWFSRHAGVSYLGSVGTVLAAEGFVNGERPSPGRHAEKATPSDSRPLPVEHVGDTVNVSDLQALSTSNQREGGSSSSGSTGSVDEHADPRR
jgi:hypothetical protein